MVGFVPQHPPAARATPEPAMGVSSVRAFECGELVRAPRHKSSWEGVGRTAETGNRHRYLTTYKQRAQHARIRQKLSKEHQNGAESFQGSSTPPDRVFSKTSASRPDGLRMRSPPEYRLRAATRSCRRPQRPTHIVGLLSGLGRRPSNGPWIAARSDSVGRRGAPCACRKCVMIGLLRSRISMRRFEPAPGSGAHADRTVGVGRNLPALRKRIACPKPPRTACIGHIARGRCRRHVVGASCRVRPVCPPPRSAAGAAWPGLRQLLHPTTSARMRLGEGGNGETAENLVRQ